MRTKFLLSEKDARMKKKIIYVVIAIAVVAILALLAWLIPGSREIDVTLTATEYRLDDPDFVVEHTVTIRGRDSRTRFGSGSFKGTISISGIEGMEDETTILASIGCEHPYATGSFDAPFEPPLSSFMPNWDYTAFLALFADVDADGIRSTGGDDAHFLVSGSADREAALAVAAELSKGTYWEGIF